MDENNLPKGFNMAMVLMDMVPVVSFAISMWYIWIRFSYFLFLFGAVCSTLAGFGKVLWKLFIVVYKRNIKFFYKQFKYMMSSGFILMVSSVIIYKNSINFRNVIKAIISFPTSACFVVSILLMIGMGYCARQLDPNDAKSNWFEQSLNVVAQLLFMIGIITAF